MKFSIAYPLLFVAALGVNAPSLIFKDPRDDPQKARMVWIVSQIPFRQGEKLLMRGENQRAQSLVVLLKSPYKAALRELRATIARKVGIRGEGDVAEIEAGIFPDREELPRGGRFRVLTFEKGFTRFRDVGLRVKHPSEYQLRSQGYNYIAEISGFSVLRLRAIDGRVLFGRDSVLLEIKRIDYTKQHPRYYDIPMPFTEAWEDDLVTDTEMRMITDTIVRLGNVKVRYFVPFPGYRGAEYWGQLMTEIKVAAEEP